MDCFSSLSENVGSAYTKIVNKPSCDHRELALKLLKHYGCVSGMGCLDEDLQRVKMTSEGLEKGMDVNDGVRSAGYKKYLAAVSKNRTSKTSQSETTGQKVSMNPFTHQMNSNSDSLASDATDIRLQTSTKLDVCWNQLELHGGKFIAGALLLYSDKSQATLGGRVLFYSLDVKILNYTEEWRKARITRGQHNPC